jgi:hypothetical protein
VPVWLFAIVAAAAAPLCVRLYASAIQKHVRKRTEQALAHAGVFGGEGRKEETKEAGG